MRGLGLIVMLGLVMVACRGGSVGAGAEADNGKSMQMIFEHVVTKQYHRGELRFILKTPRVVLDESDHTLHIQGGVWTRLHNSVWEEQLHR